ncbi:MAG TPA: hypothetical protein VHV77_15985 [Pirellulales bacterium]|jgi:hypothetical protein|nr:hypothetical protein [Pirellulales bacterium]
MESITHNVRDIDALDRRAVENLIGQPLGEDQQVVIQIVGPAARQSKNETNGAHGLPEWCNVYAGLSDQEIAEIEKIALTRADLTGTRRFS